MFKAFFVSNFFTYTANSTFMKTFINKPKNIFTVIFGVFFIIAGIGHFIDPQKYFAFIPNFLPKAASNFLAGLAEIIAGTLLMIPKFRKLGGLLILIMMVVFLPLHILDIFKENPAIGRHTLAIIRLPLQFVSYIQVINATAFK